MWNPSRRRLSLLLSSSILFLSLCIDAPVFAQGIDVFAQANALYQKGDYKGARRLYEQIVNSRPNCVPAIYQMANCDLKLNDHIRAEQEYRRCMSLKPSADLVKHCKNGIAHIHGERTVAAIVKADAIKNGGQPAGEANSLELERRKLALKLVVHAADEFSKKRDDAIKKRDDIIAHGHRLASAARDKATKEIEALRKDPNWIVQNTATGQVFVGVPTDVEDEIRDRAEAEARKHIHEAEMNARGVQVPDYDGTAHFFQSQLTDASKKGTRLDHRGTNLFIRNYVHGDTALGSTAKGTAGTTGSTGAGTSKLIAGTEEKGPKTKVDSEVYMAR